MNPKFRLRAFEAADAEVCWQLFQDTVRRVNCRDYTPQQIGAWARGTAIPDAWLRRFDGNVAYVVEQGKAIVGFADMNDGGYLDRLFVSADHQRMGVAALLMDAIERTAKEWQLTRIHTQASMTAKPFFLARGFKLVSAQVVDCGGERLTNYVMELGIG